MKLKLKEYVKEINEQRNIVQLRLKRDFNFYYDNGKFIKKELKVNDMISVYYVNQQWFIIFAEQSGKESCEIEEFNDFVLLKEDDMDYLVNCNHIEKVCLLEEINKEERKKRFITSSCDFGSPK
ncbi:hypothetical protein U8V72_20170 [Priestia filamentosa]|uniref:hypothetical protein n=1 Tax=Priestia filamentosa TaxID=1402861 RepID=UPI0039784719